MVSISNFIKENTLLCVFTLGTAILGFLGYHAVRWIINKCQKTEKIDKVAQQSIHNQPSTDAANPPKPKSLINRVSDVQVSQDKITMGQGEYIVFHKLPTGEKKPLTAEKFEEVYKVLLQYSPTALAYSGSEKGMEECGNRYELLKAKLKEMDETLEAVFIPRTLYELVFIRKCIQEDLKHKNICPYLSAFCRNFSSIIKKDPVKYQEYLKEEKAEKLKRKCWHLCYFTDTGNNEHEGVKEVAYRLNKVMLKAFDPTEAGFTHKELLNFAEKEIVFLKDHYKKGLEINEKRRQGEEVEEISSCSYPGPTTNFGFESTRGSIKPLGVRHETDAQMIRNAITLECSKIAVHSLFIFRGANFQKDSTSSWFSEDKCYSLSYGSSMFAGCVYDGGATAFHFMRDGENAYAVPIPFDQINGSLFFVPATHPVAQLFADGEIFHARTKAWKDFDVKKIGGMNFGANGDKRDHLRSQLNKEELSTQFHAYKDKAYQLK